jgi:hypothetical protein
MRSERGIAPGKTILTVTTPDRGVIDYLSTSVYNNDSVRPDTPISPECATDNTVCGQIGIPPCVTPDPSGNCPLLEAV